MTGEPPYNPPVGGWGAAGHGGPAYAPPGGWQVPASTSDRVRIAWQRRYESDYVFHFWSAFGWTILTCGIYAYYVLYQLVRRSRDHNLRRLALLDGATAFAWEQATNRGTTDELRPAFERIATNLATLRSQTTDFRDPSAWVVLGVVSGGIASIVAYCLLDGDLVTHDHAEGAVEAELSAIYARLGTPVVAPDPARLTGRHNYVGRILATLATLGIYGLFWLYDVMHEGNEHFRHNWVWEDSLAESVQALAAGGR